jgi:hypothetical protein
MAHARTTDPETSHEAAKSVTKTAQIYSSIIAALATYGPMNDEGLIHFIRKGSHVAFSDSGIRSRRSELASMGRVRDSGERIKMQSGRNSIVWELA